MRISNPTITESAYFKELEQDQALIAILIDLSRHLYSLDYARTSAVANIFNDIKSLIDHLDDDEICEYVEPEIDDLLNKIGKQNRGAYDTEVCRELANDLLSYVVKSANTLTPVEDEEWEEDEDPRNRNPPDEDEKVMNNIVAILVARNEPRSAEDIIAELTTDLSYSKIQRLLQKMCESGELIKIGYARNSKYKVAERFINPVSAKKILQKMKDDNSKERQRQRTTTSMSGRQIPIDADGEIDEEAWLGGLVFEEEYGSKKKKNPSDQARLAVEGNTSAEIINEKPLPNNEKAVLWKTIGGKPYRITILDKKNKIIARETFSDKGDAQVFFEALS